MRRWLTALVAAALLWANAGLAQTPPPEARLARQAIEQILTAWNTPELGHWLAADFAGRDQLLAALTFDVPATARLRILAIGPVQVLEQQRGAGTLTSLVSVRVRAQAEWEQPGQGLQRREGTAEYILRITREVPR
ncbi:MAG: hypothetical protein GX093_11670 [Xanthomonadaceae bacterium]|nr:hypothetical protein [Xanthomonadaceae bacterium]